MTKGLVFKSAFHSIMPKKKADRAVKVSEAMMAFRDSLESAGVPKKKVDAFMRKIKISEIL